MPDTREVIAIYGATGAQGNAIARSLLQGSAKFLVRALTRNPMSDKAQELQRLGANVVKADGFERDEMTAALQGAHGFWLNTNHHDPALEEHGMTDAELGKALISIACEAGVETFIYSTCNSSANYTEGKVIVDGYESKHEVFQYACHHGSFKSVIGAIPGWYMENFLSPEYAACFGGFPTQPDANGILNFASPELGGKGLVPWIAIGDDFGDMIHGLFRNPQQYHGQTVQCFSEEISFSEMVEAFVEATGKPARYNPQPTPEDFPTYGIGMLEEIRDIFRFTQMTNGAFFGEPNNILPAKQLKSDGARARGDHDGLTSTKEFFTKHFA